MNLPSTYCGRRPLIERVAALATLVGLHVGLFLIFEGATHRSEASVEPPDSLITVFIRPRIREAYEPASVVEPASLRVRLDPQLLALLTTEAAFDYSVPRNDSAAIVAPTLQGEARSGVQPYLQRAGLRPGQGATVVLRIEVLESGDPGRIEVDASSGSGQVDQAAIDYARIQHWYAGRVNGAPRRMWIRWGVHLQA